MRNLQLQVGDKAHDFDFETPWSARQNFYETSGNNPAVLVFLRYQGCPVCQMEMANLKRDVGLFTQKEARVFVFLQSTPEIVSSATNKEDWPFFMVCDPQGAIFQQYAVEPGGIFRYLNPAGLIGAIKATFKGFKHGKFEGKETQLPAAFAVNAKKVISYAYYGKHVSDVPSPETLASNIE